MMAQLSAPIRWLPDYFQRAKSDSLVRNSIYLIASAVVTAGLGYVFWAIAAHVFTSQEVGIGGAVISLCSTIALLTYLGSSAILIERLPAREHTSEWTTILVRVCLCTAAVTAVAITVAMPVLLRSHHYRLFFSTTLPIFVAVVGAATWTLLNLLGSAFIATRRAGLFLLIQTLVSVAKVLFILPLAAAGFGAMGLVEAWVASAVLGVGIGAAWLVPRMGLGRRSGHHPHHRASVMHDFRPLRHRRPRHRRTLASPSAGSVRHLLGQHLTGAGGALAPLVLPVLVVIRLGVTLNAYFYITWMIGSAFFMVSPSVAQAVFAEGVRARSDLRSMVVKATRVIVILLVPAMMVMIIGGRFILRLFGTSYAAVGYVLLILLAISALPDAVSNVAVAVFRVTGRLGYSTALNLSILVVALAGSWILMPRLKIAGVGIAWLGAQTIGAIASFPAYAQLHRTVALEALTVETQPHPGIAQLIELARLQSLYRIPRPIDIEPFPIDVEPFYNQTHGTSRGRSIAHDG